MPNCANCESFVTEDYVRVFAPDDMDTVRVCPDCPDRLRDGAEIREARSTRHQDHGGGEGYDEQKAKASSWGDD